MEYVYEVRPRKEKPGVDLISEALPFGRLWYSGPNATDNAISFASFYGRACDIIIRVFDFDGKMVAEQRQKAASAGMLR